MSVWFKSPDKDLTTHTIFPEIGPFGTRAVHVSRTGEGGYLINCKLPPGLPSGSHMVTLATPRGRSANHALIRIGDRTSPQDLSSPGKIEAIQIRTVADGIDWTRDEVLLGWRGGFLSLWAQNVPSGVSVEEIALQAPGLSLRACFVSSRMPDGLTQINFQIPADVASGMTSLQLIVQGTALEKIHVLFRRDEAT